MKKHILATVALLILGLQGWSQSTPNTLDEKYQPKKNAIFGGASEEERSKEDGPEAEYSHIVKFVPTALVRNLVNFQYEWLFTEGVSATGALGLSFGRDRIQQFTSEIFDGSSNNGLSFDYMMTNSKPAGSISPLVGAGIRFYYSGYYSSNDYFFEINFKSYSNNLVMISKGTPYDYNRQYIPGEKGFKVRNRTINLVYGIQYVGGSKVITTHDIYFSVGLNFLRFDEFETSETQVYDPLTGYNNTAYVTHKTGADATRLTPTVNIGYAFGIAINNKKKSK